MTGISRTLSVLMVPSYKSNVLPAALNCNESRTSGQLVWGPLNESIFQDSRVLAAHTQHKEEVIFHTVHRINTASFLPQRLLKCQEYDV